MATLATLEVTVYVKSESRRRKKFQNISLQMTIYNFKYHIQDAVKVPAKNQQLYYKTMIMADEHSTLQSYGVVDGGQILLREVCEFSIGIGVVGGLMAIVIPRNTVIPTKKSRIFSTATDNQHRVTVQVYEGEEPLTKDNKLLNIFHLTAIPPAPRGVAQIEVTFEIDDKGILRVSAVDEGSGKNNKITITNNVNQLNRHFMATMMEDDERFADEDKELNDRVESRNELESFAYSLENHMTKIKEAIEENKKWLEENPVAEAEDYKKQKKELKDVVQPIISELYQGVCGPSRPSGDEDDLEDEL